MRVLAVVSAKGGMGKTTLTANLATALTRFNRPCVAVDADPQNALGLHFGMSPTEAFGLSAANISGADFARFLARAKPQAPYLPFGRPAAAALRSFERAIGSDRQWLRKTLSGLLPDTTEWVLVDTPGGTGVWTHQALAAADAVLGIFIPDFASFATLPRALELFEACAPPGAPVWFLANKVDPQATLTRDVLAAMRSSLGARMLPFTIAADEGLREALGSRQPLVHTSSASSVLATFEKLARWLVTAPEPQAQRGADSEFAASQPLRAANNHARTVRPGTAADQGVS